MHAVQLITLAALAVSTASAAEYLPVCEKCLNPRVFSLSGKGSAAASADAKVVQEDAAQWCATNRPRDPICAREEVTNGGDGGRKAYKAAANCSTGVLNSADGYEYQYAQRWPDGAGRGRPMFKDGTNTPRGWSSIRSGYGIARAEWDKWNGYSLALQWETLCGNAAPALAAQAARPARAATPAAPSSSPETIASCSRCPSLPVTSKTGIGSANAVVEAKSGNKIVRAKANCATGRIETIDGVQYSLAGIWDNSDIGGGRTKWRGNDGEIVGRDNASGGLSVSMQWEILCPGPVTPALLRAASAPSAAPQAPATQTARQAPPPQAAPSVCTGKRYCEETNTFAAIIRDFRPSGLPDSTRLVSATIKFLNKTNRPLILGYIAASAVAIDDRGNRYVLASSNSVRGIGEIAGRQFDPKFTLQPGETADTRFEFAWRGNGRDIIGQKAWDIEFAVREAVEVGPGQYRFGAEHALQFRGVPPASAAAPLTSEGTAPMTTAPATAGNSAPADPAPAAAPANVPPRRPDACVTHHTCFDAGAFVAQVADARLTRDPNNLGRTVRLTMKIRNMGQQPLSLAYVAKSSTLADNLGKPYYWGTAGTYDMSAAGIGKVEGNKADPQFTLAPGEERSASFTLRRRAPSNDPDGSMGTWSVSLAELQVINPQQIRTAREHSVTFADFPVSAGGMTSPASAAPPARSTTDAVHDLSNAIRGLGRKK